MSGKPFVKLGLSTPPNLKLRGSGPASSSVLFPLPCFLLQVLMALISQQAQACLWLVWHDLPQAHTSWPPLTSLHLGHEVKRRHAPSCVPAS